MRSERCKYAEMEDKVERLKIYEQAAESRVKELEAEIERLRKKCDDTAFVWAEAVDKYETCDVDNEQLKATLRDREATIVSQQGELHKLRLDFREMYTHRTEMIIRALEAEKEVTRLNEELHALRQCIETHTKKYLCLERHRESMDPCPKER